MRGRGATPRGLASPVSRPCVAAGSHLPSPGPIAAAMPVAFSGLGGLREARGLSRKGAACSKTGQGWAGGIRRWSKRPREATYPRAAHGRFGHG